MIAQSTFVAPGITAPAAQARTMVVDGSKVRAATASLQPKVRTTESVFDKVRVIKAAVAAIKSKSLTTNQSAMKSRDALHNRETPPLAPPAPVTQALISLLLLLLLLVVKRAQ